MALRVTLKVETMSFLVTNNEDSEIVDLTLTTFPPILSTNILLLAYSYSKVIPSLSAGKSIRIGRGNVRNSKGAQLIDSSLKIAAILLRGRVRNGPRAQMFRLVERTWTAVPADAVFAGTEGLLLGEVEEPRLHVQVYTARDRDDAKASGYVFQNAEPHAIEGLEILVYPPAAVHGRRLDQTLAFRKVHPRVAKGESLAVAFQELHSSSGQNFLDADLMAQVISLAGIVDGQQRVALITVNRPKP